MNHWVSIWGQSHTNISSSKPSPAKRTVCFWTYASISGKAVRIRFENKYVIKGFTIGAGALLAGACSFPITFNGQPSAKLPLKADLYCDVLPININSGDLLEIRLYFPDAQRPSSGNTLREKVSLSGKRNFVLDSEISNRTMTFGKLLSMVKSGNTALPVVSAVEVDSDKETGAIVVFGDSIVQQCCWTKPFEQRLIREIGRAHV